MSHPRVSIDQWRCLLAVVDHGGYARAASQLHLSQSTINYAVSRLQSRLGLELLQVVGRRAELSDAGRRLLPQVRQLVADALELEQQAMAMAGAVPQRIVVVIDVLVPTGWLLDALGLLRSELPTIEVVVREEVMSGTDRLLSSGEVDLGLHARVPEGCSGEPLAALDLLLVVSPDHPLLQRQTRPGGRDLMRARQIFIRDTGPQPDEDGMGGSELRWTVGSRESALEMVRRGLGFSWMPLAWVADDLASGRLVELPMRQRERRQLPVYLVRPQQRVGAVEVDRLAGLIRESVLRQRVDQVSARQADSRY